MTLLDKFWIRKATFLAALLAFAAAAFLAWQHYYPAQVADGWSFEVAYDDIDRVSALLEDSAGNLYVTQEFGENGLVWRHEAGQPPTVITDRLAKPDGLASFAGGIAISQEADGKPVLWYDGVRLVPLFEAQSAEGLAGEGRYLYVIEDHKADGRLLRYDAVGKALVVLREGLVEAEGVAVCPDGRLFYTEKRKGWIKRYRPDLAGEDPVVVGGLHQPGALMCDAAGLWITEDRTHLARLLLLEPGGHLKTIMSHLRSPQTIIALGASRFLMAEQGRGRILELNRHDPR